MATIMKSYDSYSGKHLLPIATIKMIATTMMTLLNVDYTTKKMAFQVFYINKTLLFIQVFSFFFG